MSEYDDHSKERTTETVPEARVHVAKWSPWIWIVPAVAIFFVGYLIVRYGFFGGGDITVRFADARGLDRYSPVRYRGAKVGSVQKITVDEKSHSVLVRLSMDKSMDYALRKGTRFWIIELLGLIWLFARVRFPHKRGLVIRTRVYRILHRLVRWPIIIPFIAAIAAPIINFQGIDDIVAGPGATPLFAIIALLMLAIRLFEPRLMWIKAGEAA